MHNDHQEVPTEGLSDTDSVDSFFIQNLKKLKSQESELGSLGQNYYFEDENNLTIRNQTLFSNTNLQNQQEREHQIIHSQFSQQELFLILDVGHVYPQPQSGQYDQFSQQISEIHLHSQIVDNQPTLQNQQKRTLEKNEGRHLNKALRNTQLLQQLLKTEKSKPEKEKKNTRASSKQKFMLFVGYLLNEQHLTYEKVAGPLLRQSEAILNDQKNNLNEEEKQFMRNTVNNCIQSIRLLSENKIEQAFAKAYGRGRPDQKYRKGGEFKKGLNEYKLKYAPQKQ